MVPTTGNHSFPVPEHRRLGRHRGPLPCFGVRLQSGLLARLVHRVRFGRGISAPSRPEGAGYSRRASTESLKGLASPADNWPGQSKTAEHKALQLAVHAGGSRTTVIGWAFSWAHTATGKYRSTVIGTWNHADFASDTAAIYRTCCPRGIAPPGGTGAIQAGTAIAQGGVHEPPQSGLRAR